MPMHHRIAGLAVAIALAAGCTHGANGGDGISLESAISIAREAARKEGIDIDNYGLSQIAPPVSYEGKEWLIAFDRTEAPWRPGNTFLVAVDKATGDASVMPGQ